MAAQAAVIYVGKEADDSNRIRNTCMNNLKTALACCFFLFLYGTQALATVYNVEPFQLRDAVNAANANPGKDTIFVKAGRLQPTITYIGASGTSIVITDSVDIIGPGSSELIISDMLNEIDGSEVGIWVSPSGIINGGSVCDGPSKGADKVVVFLGRIVEPFVVEGSGPIEVLFKGMQLKKNLGAITSINPDAVVSLEDVHILESWPPEWPGGGECSGGNTHIIDALGQLNMTDVYISENHLHSDAPQDSVVNIKGGARLERVRFFNNPAYASLYTTYDGVPSREEVLIRESVFDGGVAIVGNRATFVNTRIDTRGGLSWGVQGLDADITMINSTIIGSTVDTAGGSVYGFNWSASHVWGFNSNIKLSNTVVDGRLGGSLPMVGADGSGVLIASSDSHITDGSGPAGPTTGSANLNPTTGVPLGPPTLDGGNDAFAFDPDTGQILTIDGYNRPRIQGPAVDKGAFEVLNNFTRDDTYVVNQDTLFDSGSASVLDNDTTYGGGAIVANLITPPAKGTLNFQTDGTFTYNPAPGEWGTVDFTYNMVVNGVDANPATVQLNILRNYSIRTEPDFYSVQKNSKLEANTGNGVGENDDLVTLVSYVRSKSPRLRIVKAPDHASSFSYFEDAGTFIYRPETDFVGTDTFTYHVWFNKTGEVASKETVVTIKVLDDNQPPIAQDDAYSTQQGVELKSDSTLIANDSDPDGNSLTVIKKSDTLHGTVTLISTAGQFTYTNLDPAFTGTDSFTYAVSDGLEESNIATVTITVNAVNKPPVAKSDKYRLPAATLASIPARGGVLRNDSDPDGDGLTVALFRDAAHGTLSLQADGAFSYQPDPGFSGTDVFEYRLSDGQSSVSGQVILIVTPLNQPPVGNADTYYMVQDTKLVVPAPSLLANDIDPEGHELYITEFQAPSNGQYTFDTSGAFVYIPDPGFVGVEVMSYKVSDGDLTSDAVVVTVEVKAAPLNQPPVAHNDAWSMQSDGVLQVAPPGVMLNDTDPEGHPLTATLLTMPATGVFAPIDGGGFTYRPLAGFSGQVSFTYIVSDGHSDSAPATGVITVNAVNRAPVAQNDAYAMNAGLSLQISPPGLLANDSDPDGDALTVAINSPPSHGLLSNDGAGGFQYSPAFGFSGVDSFKYVAYDGSLESNEATVQITVSSFNRAPVAVDDAWTTPQDTALTVPSPGVLANDGDPEGQPLTWQVGTAPAHGSLVPVLTGGFTYTPAAGYFGADSFTYRVNDGLINSNYATVRITVNQVNRAPVANDDAYSIPQGSVLKVPVPGVMVNDTDPDGDQLAAMLLTQPSHGLLVPINGGGFDYHPDSGFTGTDSFTYEVSDGQLDSGIATVRVTVNAVNRAPVAVDDAYSMQQDTVLKVPVPGVMVNDSDPDGDQLAAMLLTQPSHGHLVPINGGGFDYYPDSGYFGTDSFTYRVSDGQLDSAIATVRITVAQLPQEPAVPVPVLDRWAVALLALLLLAAGLASGLPQGRRMN